MVKAQAIQNKKKPKKPSFKTNPLKNKIDLPPTSKVQKEKTAKKVKRSKKLWWKKIKEENRGVVYISHLPHGFYEDQLKDYFSQFGKITGVNVPRSKSGNDKGYAFIEFHHPEVAQIAAETMDNYLMFNRVIKAKYIPPNEQKRSLFERMRQGKETLSVKEKAEKRVVANRQTKNKSLVTSLEAKKAIRLLAKMEDYKKTMEKQGLDAYDFQVNIGNIQDVLKRYDDMKTKQQEERSEINNTSIVMKTNQKLNDSKTKQKHQDLKPKKTNKKLKRKLVTNKEPHLLTTTKKRKIANIEEVDQPKPTTGKRHNKEGPIPKNLRQPPKSEKNKLGKAKMNKLFDFPDTNKPTKKKERHRVSLKRQVEKAPGELKQMHSELKQVKKESRIQEKAKTESSKPTSQDKLKHKKSFSKSQLNNKVMHIKCLKPMKVK